MVHSYSRKATMAFSILMLMSAMPVSLRATSSNQTFKDVAWGAAVVGGVAAAVGAGAYALYSWLTPSDEEVLHGAQREVANFNFNQYPYVNDLGKLLGGFAQTQYAQDKVIATLNEPILYQLSYTYSQNGSMLARLDELSSQISVFRDRHAALRERINAIEQSNNYEKQFIKNEMIRVGSDIAHILEPLTFAYRYLSNHRSYFFLIEGEYNIYKVYAQELEVLPYVYNAWDLARSLHAIILSKQQAAGARFPYKSYVETIDRDIKGLERAINNVSYNYAERLAYARDLDRKLNAIKLAIVADPAYIQDVQAYEREKLAQAQLALQQQKLELMQQQALLAQQQAQALKEQNRLKRIELERETQETCELSVRFTSEIKI